MLSFEYYERDFNKIEGGPFGDKKVAQCRKNNRGTLQSRPVSQMHEKKFLAKGGTRTRDHWVPPKSITVCTKKWYIQGEVCSLTKETSHCNSRELFLRKAPTEKLKIANFEHLKKSSVNLTFGCTFRHTSKQHKGHSTFDLLVSMYGGEDGFDEVVKQIRVLTHLVYLLPLTVCHTGLQFLSTHFLSCPFVSQRSRLATEQLV